MPASPVCECVKERGGTREKERDGGGEKREKEGGREGVAAALPVMVTCLTVLQINNVIVYIGVALTNLVYPGCLSCTRRVSCGCRRARIP